MPVAGPAQTERVQQHELTRRVGQMIIAAQHLRDSHCRVIDRIAEEERGSAVIAPYDEIADFTRGESLRPMYRIVKFDDLSARHGEPKCRPQAACGPLGALRCRQ